MNGDISRTPRVGNINDPGKPGAKCVFVAANSDGQPGQENDFCFCLVAGIDLSAVGADPEVETLFEIGDDQPLDGLRAWLDNTPAGLGWSAGKVDRLKGRLNSRGVPNANLSEHFPLWEFANRIARKYSTPNWDIRRAKTTRAGA
jgi:hypothetical protein